MIFLHLHTFLSYVRQLFLLCHLVHTRLKTYLNKMLSLIVQEKRPVKNELKWTSDAHFQLHISPELYLDSLT